VANSLKCAKCGGGLELAIWYDGIDDKGYDIQLSCKVCPYTYPIARTSKQGELDTVAVEPYK